MWWWLCVAVLLAQVQIVPPPHDHILWMVENHPAWEAFLSPMEVKLSNKDYSRIKGAWLRNVETEQVNHHAVLHNAALFFAYTELARAEALLLRATQLQPAALEHVERLGKLYGDAQASKFPDSAFAAHAWKRLLESNDWIILATAVETFSGKPVSPDDKFPTRLYARLMFLTRGNQTFEDLPSRTTTYNGDQCKPIPLLVQ